MPSGRYTGKRTFCYLRKDLDVKVSKLAKQEGKIKMRLLDELVEEGLAVREERKKEK